MIQIAAFDSETSRTPFRCIRESRNDEGRHFPRSARPHTRPSPVASCSTHAASDQCWALQLVNPPSTFPLRSDTARYSSTKTRRTVRRKCYCYLGGVQLMSSRCRYLDLERPKSGPVLDPWVATFRCRSQE